VRYGPKGKEKPGLIDSNGKIRDLSKQVDDIGGATLSPASLKKLGKVNAAKLPLVKGNPRIGPCVGNIGKFLCIGLNYADHAAESGLAVPPEPVLFMKANNAICGPNDNVEIPRKSKKTDWEVELGVVIGSAAKYVSEKDAMKHVAGFCVINDVSEREFQIERAGTWDKGKGCDTFGPIGPWLVTKDEVKNPQNLAMWLTVNGESRQNGTTHNMVFGVAHLVWYCSQFFVLEPGDVIVTGTPPGVGMGVKPNPKFLKAGDEVRLGIDGLGEQRQKIVKFKM
jgi:ureidoglycolate lyase